MVVPLRTPDMPVWTTDATVTIVMSVITPTLTAARLYGFGL
jgi:hypothetical protein